MKTCVNIFAHFLCLGIFNKFYKKLTVFCKHFHMQQNKNEQTSGLGKLADWHIVDPGTSTS